MVQLPANSSRLFCQRFIAHPPSHPAQALRPTLHHAWQCSRVIHHLDPTGRTCMDPSTATTLLVQQSHQEAHYLQLGPRCLDPRRPAHRDLLVGPRRHLGALPSLLPINALREQKSSTDNPQTYDHQTGTTWISPHQISRVENRPSEIIEGVTRPQRPSRVRGMFLNSKTIPSSTAFKTRQCNHRQGGRYGKNGKESGHHGASAW